MVKDLFVKTNKSFSSSIYSEISPLNTESFLDFLTSGEETFRAPIEFFIYFIIENVLNLYFSFFI